MEKVLCKKNLIGSNPKFYMGNLYEHKEGPFPWHGIHHPEGYVIGLSETNDFYEYFYSPEETKNILRTKLIDKILKK